MKYLNLPIFILPVFYNDIFVIDIIKETVYFFKLTTVLTQY